MQQNDQKLKIYLLDSDKEYLNILEDNLIGLDINVVGKNTNGKNAIEAIKKMKPDAVILDTYLNDMTGFEVVESVHHLTNCFFLSSQNERFTLEKASKSKIKYYFTKPFDPEYLINKIIKILNNSSSKQVIETAAQLGTVITNFIQRMGVQPNVKGYQFMRDCLIILALDNEALNALTKMVYYDVAKKYGTSPNNVERAIHNSIKRCIERKSIDVLIEIFPTIAYGETNIKNKDFFRGMIRYMNKNFLISRSLLKK